MNLTYKKIVQFAMSLSLAFSVVAIPVSAGAVAATTDDTASRTTRVEAYKKALKDTLTTAAKTRITERCVAAQALIKTKITNNTKVADARQAAYDVIVIDLQTVMTEATAKKVNITLLQANVTALQAKVTAFNTANTTYAQALTDVSALDCKTDPTAFKAALEAVRTDQAAVLTAAKDIRTYLTDTVKVTLKTIKTALSATAQ
jgi:hypothetical protein